ncbi:MAG: hypothetical protein B6241_09865 [Spirochaetaceae bacterium 4572_59]|nr:MAG: hypothetical protein B6241_09865 [Spirochaetaceae bacterium 4572_59]
MSLDNVQSLIDLCRGKKIRIVTAESCTGGLIGGALTDLSGSSDIFWGGFLTYANEAKSAILGVSEDTLETKGAVSEEVVRQMLDAALVKSGTELSIAVSGVAGPGGGTPEKPVGTVWIGVALKGYAYDIRKYLFDGNRQFVREKTVLTAVKMAENIILNDSCLDSK